MFTVTLLLPPQGIGGIIAGKRGKAIKKEYRTQNTVDRINQRRRINVGRANRDYGLTILTIVIRWRFWYYCGVERHGCVARHLIRPAYGG
jgi:hypothetical protein